MEPQTLADFFSVFPGTFFPECLEQKAAPETCQTILGFKDEEPKDQALHRPNPRCLLKLRLLLKSGKSHTIKSIAEAIGVSQTSLYWYANNKGKVEGWADIDFRMKSYIELNSQTDISSEQLSWVTINYPHTCNLITS